MRSVGFVAGAVFVAVGSPARADDLQLDKIVARHERDAETEPYLELDPVFRPNAEGLGTLETKHQKQYELLGARIVIDGVEHTNEVDVPTRGWRAGLRISRDVGPVTVTAGMSVENVQSRYTRGTYREMGIAITKTFKLSRWNTAWISLSVGRRTWYGDQPPPGEQDATQVMLSVGTTFK